MNKNLERLVREEQAQKEASKVEAKGNQLSERLLAMANFREKFEFWWPLRGDLGLASLRESWEAGTSCPLELEEEATLLPRGDYFMPNITLTPQGGGVMIGFRLPFSGGSDNRHTRTEPWRTEVADAGRLERQVSEFRKKILQGLPGDDKGKAWLNPLFQELEDVAKVTARKGLERAKVMTDERLAGLRARVAEIDAELLGLGVSPPAPRTVEKKTWR